METKTQRLPARERVALDLEEEKNNNHDRGEDDDEGVLVKESKLETTHTGVQDR